MKEESVIQLTCLFLTSSVLREIGNQKYNYEQGIEALKIHQCVESNLTQAREHFSKLKFNFIELETKLRFLQHLKSYDSTPASLPLLAHETVKAEKIKTKEIKTDNLLQRETVADLAEAVVNERKALDEHAAEVQIKFEELSFLRQTLQQHRQQQQLEAQSQMDADQLHEVQAETRANSDLIAKHRDRREALHANIEVLHCTLAALKQNLSMSGHLRDEQQELTDKLKRFVRVRRCPFSTPVLPSFFFRIHTLSILFFSFSFFLLFPFL